MSGLLQLLDQSLGFQLALTLLITWVGLRVLDRFLWRGEGLPPGGGEERLP